METIEWLTILAILLAPLAALQVSALLERRREKRQRRFELFKTLMATRASGLSPDHVRALNSIDVEFEGKDKKSKAVLHAWRAYHDHLGSSQEDREHWRLTKQGLLVDLLYHMAQGLGYDFDKTSIKNTSYLPDGYLEADEHQLVIRRGFAAILSGKAAIPIAFYSDDEADEDDKEKLKKIGNDFLKHGRIRVELVSTSTENEDINSSLPADDTR